VPERMIHESALSSETLGTLSHFAERLFWRLIPVTDDFGRFNAAIPVIAGRCLTYVKTTPEEIETALVELEECGAIRRYEVEGKRFGTFPAWKKYQRRRADKSKFPPPPSSADICQQAPADVNNCGSRAESNSHSNLNSSPDQDLDPNRTLEAIASDYPNAPKVEPRPEPEAKPRARRETAWPENFALTDDMREFAKAAEIDPDREFEAWRDDCAAHGRRYVDWVGAWRTRIRNAPKFAGRASPNGHSPPQRPAASQYPNLKDYRRNQEAAK
jgi:hypothetical protein